MSRLQTLMVTAMKEHLTGGKRKLPDGSVILWNAFIALSRSRTSGPTGPNPISFTEIEAWSRLMRVPLDPHHVQIIIAMDRVWMKHAHRDSSAPEGVKTVPRSSEHKLTPAMFDLALR